MYLCQVDEFYTCMSKQKNGIDKMMMGLWWPSGRASASESSGPGFKTHNLPSCVLEKDTLTSPVYW